MAKTLLTASAAVILLLAGCNRSDSGGGHSHGGGGDHGHEHEEKTAQISVWTDRYEVFAEHKAPVAGKSTTFITHVTDLKTLEPRREGPVTFRLWQENGTPIEHLQAAPARAGIYLPALTFPSAGKWLVSVTVEEEEVKLGAVDVYGNEDEAAHAEMPEAPEGITFLKEQQWKILSKAEPALKREVRERKRLLATVTPKPGSMASVTAPVSGRLVLGEGKVLPLPGQKVEEGEVLILLKPLFSEQAARLLETEASTIRAKASFEQAKLNFERVRELAKKDAKSAREVQEAEFAFKSAQAAYEAASALQQTYRKNSKNDSETAADLSSVELRSPISGTIVHVGSNLGDVVTAEQTLFSIANADTVWLEAKLPESRLAGIADRPSASFGGKESATNEAAFVFRGMQLDAATKTVPITFEASNANSQLLLGQAVDLYVQTRRVENAVAVPESALVDEDGNPVVFVQLGGETFEKREVKIGIRGGGFAQVLEGVNEGERVVTKGAYAVRLSSVSSVIPAHGHAH